MNATPAMNAVAASKKAWMLQRIGVLQTQIESKLEKQPYSYALSDALLLEETYFFFGDNGADTSVFIR